MVIPSLTDPSVAPPGKHVLSCFVQYAPYKLRPGLNWDDQKEAFGDTVVNTIAEYAPNIKDIILHRQVVTPLDLEREWGLSEGNIFQGELSLEQLFFLRPVPGCARYRTPIKNLYMCGSATHPGGGIMGAPGRFAALEMLKDIGGSGITCQHNLQPRHRHHRRRPQRTGHRLLPCQSRIQAASARTPRAGRRRCHHRRISSRLPLLYAGAHRWSDPCGHRPRHATGKTWTEADHA